MVMTHRRAVLLYAVENSGLVSQVLIESVDPGNEDEVQVAALRIEVRHVGHAYRVGPRMAVAPDAGMHRLEIGPVDAALERIDHDAKILQVLAHVRIQKPPMLPRSRDEAGRAHRAMAPAGAGYHPPHMAGESCLSVGSAQHQAPLAGPVAARGHQGVEHRAVDTIQLQRHIGFLRIGKPEDARQAKLALHDLSGRLLGAVPVAKDI